MSIEIWQFPRSATKAELVSVLRELGYVAGENLFWSGPDGTTSLFWSEPRDFKSTSGVDASIFPLDDEGKEAWQSTNDWALRTRTPIWATSFDQEVQNQTVRRVRKVFGGSFYNDHFGHNRYSVIDRQPSTPASRGIYAVLTRLEEELNKLEYGVPGEVVKSLLTPHGEITPETDKTGILRLAQREDPSRTVYNALVPFLVAVIENYFRTCFEVLLRYDKQAQLKLETSHRTVSFSEAAAVSRGELTIEEVASGWFSFQNINAIHRAFNEVFGIDIWKALRRRKRVRDKLPLMFTYLGNLIEARHGVVHHLLLDRDLDRERFIDMIHFARMMLQLIANEFERKLGVKLGPG